MGYRRSKGGIYGEGTNSVKVYKRGVVGLNLGRLLLERSAHQRCVPPGERTLENPSAAPARGQQRSSRHCCSIKMHPGGSELLPAVKCAQSWSGVGVPRAWLETSCLPVSALWQGFWTRARSVTHPSARGASTGSSSAAAAAGRAQTQHGLVLQVKKSSMLQSFGQQL